MQFVRELWKKYKAKFTSEVSSNICNNCNGRNAHLQAEPRTLYIYKLVWHTLSVLVNKTGPVSKLEHRVTSTDNYCFLPTSVNTEKTSLLWYVDVPGTILIRQQLYRQNFTKFCSTCHTVLPMTIPVLSLHVSSNSLSFLFVSFPFEIRKRNAEQDWRR